MVFAFFFPLSYSSLNRKKTAWLRLLKHLSASRFSVFSCGRRYYGTAGPFCRLWCPSLSIFPLSKRTPKLRTRTVRTRPPLSLSISFFFLGSLLLWAFIWRIPIDSTLLERASSSSSRKSSSPTILLTWSSSSSGSELSRKIIRQATESSGSCYYWPRHWLLFVRTQYQDSEVQQHGSANDSSSKAQQDATPITKH